MTTTIVRIPFKSTAIHAMSDEGKPLVSLRHMCESIGLDVESQRKRINRSAWGRAVIMTAHDSTGRAQQMTMIDRKVMTIWLATVDTSRVKAEARTMLEAFQNEAADALDSYFHEGGAINPNATTSQLSDMELRLKEAHGITSVIEKLRGILPDKYLENKSRIVLARAMGEVPTIAPEDMPLIVETYLKANGLKGADLKACRSTFGRRISKAYYDHHGVEPESAPAEVNGRTVSIKHYTETDRHLFDLVWNQYYASTYEPSLMEELSA